MMKLTRLRHGAAVAHQRDITVSTISGLENGNSIDAVGSHPCHIPSVRSPHPSNVRQGAVPSDSGPIQQLPTLRMTKAQREEMEERKAKGDRMRIYAGVFGMVLLLVVICAIVGVTLRGKKSDNED